MQAELLDLMKKRLVEGYGDDASKSDSYPRMVNARHFAGVKNYLEDALQSGAIIVAGGRTNAAEAINRSAFISWVDCQL